MQRKAEEIKKIVRDGYSKAVTQNTSCCSTNSCCGGTAQAKNISKKVGYSDSEMSAVPERTSTKLATPAPNARALNHGCPTET